MHPDDEAVKSHRGVIFTVSVCEGLSVTGRKDIEEEVADSTAMAILFVRGERSSAGLGASLGGLPDPPY